MIKRRPPEIDLADAVGAEARRNMRGIIPLGLLYFLVAGNLSVAPCQELSKTEAGARPPAAVRTVNVRVYVDPEFQKRADWKSIVERRAVAVSRMYAQFGIAFKNEDLQTWSPNEANGVCPPVDQLNAELAPLVKPTDPEIALGYTSLPDKNRSGCSRGWGRAAVVNDDGQLYSDLEVELHIAHEFAHLFGMWHVPDKETIMGGYTKASPIVGFDAQSQEVLALMRSFDFYRGVAGINQQTEDKLTTIFKDHKQLAETVNPLSAAHETIGAKLAQDRNEEQALAELKLAIQLDDRNAEAYRDYGHLLLATDRAAGVKALGEAMIRFAVRMDGQAREGRDLDAMRSRCSALQVDSILLSFDPQNRFALNAQADLNSRCTNCDCGSLVGPD